MLLVQSQLAIKDLVCHYLKKGVFQNYLETLFWTMNIGFIHCQTTQIHTILDVGANIGLFSVAAKIHFPRACIHAYEPNLDVKKHLDHQASTFGFKAIYEAIGKTSGRATLSKNLECDTAARVNQDESGNIRITSLSEAIDGYDEKFVDLLKLDCEGYEHQLMEEKGPWNNCRYLAMEYHLGPDMKPESICSTIQDLGFEILNMSSRNPVLGNILAKRVNNNSFEQ